MVFVICQKTFHLLIVLNVLPFEEIKADKMAFADAFRIQYDEQDPFYGRPIVQKHGDRYVVQNVPALPLTQEQMDAAYDLPYTRKWHPSYDDKGAYLH